MRRPSFILIASCICVFCGCFATGERPSNVPVAKDGRQIAAAQFFADAQKESRIEKLAETEKRRLLREKSENGWTNENALRDFALKESPRLWQTVQAIRAQVAVRRKSVAQLETDLREFNVDPAADADYRRLNEEIDSLLDSMSTVFGNLEEAYIASKKFELAPTSTNDKAIVKRILEDGIKESDSAAKRYREMTVDRKEKHHE